MTAIAATTGTIRSRVDGTLVLALEIDPGQAQEAFRLFGSPGTQVAIAALRDGSFLAQKSEVVSGENVAENDKNTLKTPDKPKIGDACMLAVTWCKDPQFWEWCGAVDAESAKAFICRVCVVSKRKHLDEIPAALERWNELVRKPYRDYLIQKGQ